MYIIYKGNKIYKKKQLGVYLYAFKYTYFDHILTNFESNVDPNQLASSEANSFLVSLLFYQSDIRYSVGSLC